MDKKTTNVTQAGYLKIHIKAIHNSQRDHKCDSCGKAFSHAGDLKKHTKQVHAGWRDLRCDFCGKYFSQSWVLKRHINTVHDVEKRPQCKKKII